MTCHGAWRLAETGGERLLLGHGDRLCTRDWSYQALRWTLTGPLGRAVRRWTPWPLARRLVERVQERPKVPFCHTPLGEHDIQAPAAAAALAAHGADHLVCGHLHVPEDRRLRPGDPQPRLHILPAWRNDRGWLSWEAGAFARHRP
jgi:UDP-2,3-diacylglucosamine hydrolase